MTETELKQSIAQGEQDNIALDYTKWSNQQIQAKRSNDHGLWQQERDRVLRRQQSDNEAAKRQRLDTLEAERKAQQAERDAEIDRHLEPQKQRLMRDWLANNPNQTPTDFEKKAWIHLRQNLVEQAENGVMQATMNDLTATGRYSL